MANRTLQTSIIAKAAVRILENELGAAKAVYRGYEDEFSKSVNGYEVGDTISIRRPADFTVRNGAVASNQDVSEGKTSLVINNQKGIDFSFTSKELTLDITELSERVIRPAMIQLANQVDKDLLGLATSVPNWVGTPGESIKSFKDFATAVERMDELGVPKGDRSAFLAPSDFWGLLGTQTNLYVQDAARGAYREGALGNIAGVNTFMSQNVATFTTGSRSGATIAVNGAITAATVTWEAVRDTNVQTIGIDGLGAATQTLAAGDVFTIADVYDVNPVTKQPLPFLKQFTVVENATGVTSAIAALKITPAMIWSGAHQTVAVKAGVTDLDNKAITPVGTASTGYRQSMVFHKNAFALVMAPLVAPPGAVDVARESYKGISARLVPYYDGTNDVSKYRLDILYGIKAVDPRLAIRVSGSAAA